MKHLFGHKWATTYGAVATEKSGQLTAAASQWLFDLRDFSAEQVAQGLSKLQHRGDEWPPGPSEFVKLCLGVPTIEEVCDRANDYGPICGAIRARMDWFNLDSMVSRQFSLEALRQYRQAITSLSRVGEIHRLALSAASRPLSISDEAA